MLDGRQATPGSNGGEHGHDISTSFEKEPYSRDYEGKWGATKPKP